MSTLIARIAHGTDHMPATALAMRVLVVLFGTGLAIVHSDPWVGALTGTTALAAGVISLIELRNAAIECEQAGDDNQDQGETGFGWAG